MRQIKPNSRWQQKSLNILEIETVCGLYEGRNILEGFRANTEKVCNQKSSDSTEVHGDQNEFYKMCISDNFIIFEMTSDENIRIPQMELSELKDILFRRLKLNKACDVYKLTVEHL